MRNHQTPPRPVRIPADVERDDPILFGLSARQLALLAGVGAVLYVGWLVAETRVPVQSYAAAALPIAAVAVVIVVGRRDGISLDRWLIAAARQRLTPRHYLDAPEGTAGVPDWLVDQTTAEGSPSRYAQTFDALPGRDVDRAGVIDLGADGSAVAAAVSTLNLALRTPAEQEALVATFARYLHSLTGPTQILIRTSRVDLTGQVTALQERAQVLPHPDLASAAWEHADYLNQLAGSVDLLSRQVLLVLREPTTPGQSATATAAVVARLQRRLDEATTLLHPAGITVTPLDEEPATALLAAACNPGTPTSMPAAGAVARPGELITAAAAGTGGWDDDPTAEEAI